MSPKQKKIAAKAPPPNKITGADFAVLKKEKAKGRGMGLQDESIKPGKVQKAFLGKMIKGVGKSMGRIFGRKQSATATPGATVSQKASLPINIVEEYKKAKGLKVGGTMKANKGKSIDTKAFKKTLGVMPTIDKAFPRLKADPTKPISSVKPNVSNSYMKSIGVFPKVSGPLKKKKIPGRIGTALGIGAMMVPAAYAAAKQYKDYKSAKNRDKAKVKKYSKGMSKEDITREGKRGIAAGKALGESLRDKNAPMKRQRLADRQTSKKMVGGMAKKYNKGGEGRLRSAYVYDQTVKNTRSEGRTHTTMKDMKETRREEYGAAKDRYPSKKDKLKGIAKRVGSLTPFMPTVSVAKGVYDKLSQSTVRKYSKGGGMMQRPMGYKSGTMVKARGCKLGRTRPTKIT
jgi:hypothetical protein